ncbi:MAG: hypothetical protein Q4P34_06715 [Tissierellia bacterium]|nr:hypothetical protein [Tissierellia bacterium]
MKREEFRNLLKRGIIAISPVYEKGIGDVTKIKLEDGEETIDRNIKTVVENIAKTFMLDLTESRRYYGQYLDKKKNIPLVYNSDNIYIVVKTRYPIGINDGAMSYVNCKYVKGSEGGVIKLNNGDEIKTFTSDRTIRKNLKELNYILRDLESRSV